MEEKLLKNHGKARKFVADPIDEQQNLENLQITLESRDTVEVLDDPNLHVRCKLHASLNEREQEYVRFFVSSPRREDPILDSHLYEDGEDRDVGDEEHVDVFEDV
ncbi:hypothetical protein Fot_06696 [Forsythia ovata]|uniref:Uncharacterized protein n=1 Tax=Forsythia ovata TaxID=205694 RepID=A0ABD1WTP1_9LAMI